MSETFMCCQVFYTVFYSPDNQLYTNEVTATESMANALIVSLTSVYFYISVLCT